MIPPPIPRSFVGETPVQPIPTEKLREMDAKLTELENNDLIMTGIDFTKCSWERVATPVIQAK